MSSIVKISRGVSSRTIYAAKCGIAALAAGAALSLTAVAARAGPIGGQVISGSGSISQSGSITNITQASPNLSLNWTSFNIAPKETVNFLQPSASAVAVNRILGTNGTQILGYLHANGQVFLINSNGIVFGPTAEVNVGGLVASTLDFNEAGVAGNTKSFSGPSTGSVVNQGTINANQGGYVALIGNHVSNEGVISAQLGTVALGAGSAVTLTFGGSSHVRLQVDQSVVNSLAENGGLIRADGGQVFMTAGAHDALMASVVNNTGVIEARTLESHEGTITLLGGMTAGTVKVGGILDASAPNGGDGGLIETSAAYVEVADGARVTTAAPAGLYGSWLIDPQDFTVAAIGGDITGAELSTNLATTGVVLQSSSGATAGSGNVNVNDAISWSANTTLTMTASNNVNANANITATGNTAGIVINPNTANGTETASGTGTFNLNNGASINLPGRTPSLSIAGTAYTVINSLGAAGSTTGTDLQGMNGGLSGHYALGSNIDASATSGWNAGAGFVPIGSSATAFTGTFDGLNNTVSGLTISLTTPNVGLFGYTGIGATIRNVGLVGGSVTGGAGTGGLIGDNGPGNPVSNSYATGSVSGAAGTGGLVGSNTTGAISKSYATGSVSGAAGTGGLVGSSTSGAISNSYSTGSVNGAAGTGGLIGSNTSGAISNSYATGGVNGGTGAGVGGLIGSNTSGTVTNSYAAGGVSGTGASLGALLGSSDAGVITNSYWDKTTSLVQSSAGGGIGMTTAQMMTQANFISATAANSPDNPAWDFANTWVMYEGLTYPLLSDFMTPLTVTASNVSKSYGQANPAFGVSYSTTPTDNLLGTVSYSGAAQTAINIGSYAISPGGLYSNQQGYIIIYANGALSISPATLTVTANAANRLYGAVEPAFSGSVTGFVAGDTQGTATTGSEVFATNALLNSNVGRYSITGSGLTANNGNYVFVQDAGNATALNITPASLMVTGESAANKVYDGTLTAALTGGTLSGVVSGDTVTLTQAGSFASKNVATGIVVTANDSVGGASAGNYTLTEPLGLTANITPAMLTYTATSASFIAGQTPAGLSGTLSGFVPADTESNATTGTLAWTTTAGSSSQVGMYAIDGRGLAARNYVFAQATGNYDALTLTLSTPPAMLQNVVAELDSILPSPQINIRLATLNLTPSVVTLSEDACITAAVDACIIDTRTTADAMIPTLRIVNGGVRLPDNRVNAEK